LDSRIESHASFEKIELRTVTASDRLFLFEIFVIGFILLSLLRALGEGHLRTNYFKEKRKMVMFLPIVFACFQNALT
jgi:hypothetical protein